MSKKSTGANKKNKDAPIKLNESCNDESKLEENKKLCALVEKHPVLYDIDDKRAAAWEDIAKSWGKPVDKCKSRWTNIRNTYKKSLEKEEICKDYYLAEYLKFLNQYLILNVPNNDTPIKTEEKNEEVDNKDSLQLDMQKLNLNQSTPLRKKNTKINATEDDVKICITINKR